MSTMEPSHTHSPHIAVIPSAGMGHLTPFLRLASLLLSRNCSVTLLTAKSTVSNAESRHISFFLATHPRVKHLEFDLIPPLQSSNSSAQDPFSIQYNAISRSAHLLHPLLSSSSPPLSAIFSDLLVAKTVACISADLLIPYYLVFTSSARFLSFMLYLPAFVSNPDKFNSNAVEVEIPGLSPLPISRYSSTIPEPK